jgi:hypothetical protein
MLIRTLLKPVLFFYLKEIMSFKVKKKELFIIIFAAFLFVSNTIFSGKK